MIAMVAVCLPSREPTELVEALLDPACYPYPVAGVRLIETHISRVFLAGDYVYKLRRPVNLGFADFSTLGKRRADCLREVELNRALAPGVYLGVERITRRGGRIVVGGSGKTVEYAVKMRRLPESSFLDAMVRAGEARPEHVEAVAEAVAGFHAGAPTGDRVSRYGHPRALAATWRQSFEQWRPWVGRLLSEDEDRELRTFVRRSLRGLRGAFLARMEDGRIREVHGDLRPSQVAVEHGRPLILDRVEFNRRLRCTDVAADVAFLMMELDAGGRLDLSRAFLHRYLEASGDFGLAPVLNFYLCQRAAVRAKVGALRSAQLTGREREDAEREARRLFALALSYARRPPWLFLAVMGGLSGTGKTTLAGEVARRTGATLISSDVVRKRLAGLAPEQRAPADFEGGIYTRDWTDRTYAALVSAGRRSLRSGRPAILDATFLQRWQRERARALAVEFSIPFTCLETVLPEREALARLQARCASGRGESDADPAIYLAQSRSAEAPNELSPTEHVRIDMRGRLSTAVAGALEALMRPFVFSAG